MVSGYLPVLTKICIVDVARTMTPMCQIKCTHIMIYTNKMCSPLALPCCTVLDYYFLGWGVYDASHYDHVLQCVVYVASFMS